jgi:hypothetical protein
VKVLILTLILLSGCTHGTGVYYSGIYIDQTGENHVVKCVEEEAPPSTMLFCYDDEQRGQW